MAAELDHRRLYRLPWNLSDNPIAWLEPTQACNLACDGCYRENEKLHKTLDQVDDDLAVFDRLRTFDGVSIAGGDPLMHPEIVDIVGRVTRSGRKAIINTNGLALTPTLLHDLKRAGLCGMTFHIDSRQGRPKWRDKNEVQLNELRLSYAEMLAHEGDIACAFNSTVYEDTLPHVPDLVDWAARNIRIVHTMVFITFRAAMPERFDYFCGGNKVEIDPLVYTTEAPRRIDITSREVVKTIQERFPDYMPCAYLNGTASPDSFKWLVAMRVGDGKRIHGYAGPKFMETVQNGYHLFTGRYMSYSHPDHLSSGRSLMSIGWAEPGLRRTATNYLRWIARHPLDVLKKQYLQAVVHIQPIDVLDDGSDSMCDGCPDMTVHEGKLVWSCRLEEPRKFGRFLTAAPKNGAARCGPTAMRIAP